MNKQTPRISKVKCPGPSKCWYARMNYTHGHFETAATKKASR